jgi:hypothetical protein
MTKPQRYGTSAAPRDDGIFCLYAEYEKLVAERNAALLDAERYRKWVSYSGFTKAHTDATLDAIEINEYAAKDKEKA